MLGTRSKFGVKKMGELDQKAFLAACKEKTAKLDDDELAILCSKWMYEIGQPEWHPFKVIVVDGQEKVLHFMTALYCHLTILCSLSLLGMKGREAWAQW
jgi:hypothetical protein